MVLILTLLNAGTGEIQAQSAQTVSCHLGKEACNIVEFHARKTEIIHIPHTSCLISQLFARTCWTRSNRK